MEVAHVLRLVDDDSDRLEVTHEEQGLHWHFEATEWNDHRRSKTARVTLDDEGRRHLIKFLGGIVSN